MKFIELEVRTALIDHGFDSYNKEIIEECEKTEYINKLIALERIQSISESYLLVTSSNNRMMYWEYKMGFDELKRKLDQAGLVIK